MEPQNVDAQVDVKHSDQLFRPQVFDKTMCDAFADHAGRVASASEVGVLPASALQVWKKKLISW